MSGGVWTNPFAAGADEPGASGAGVPGPPSASGPPGAPGARPGPDGPREAAAEPVRAALVLPLTDAARTADALALAGVGLDLVPVPGVGLVVPLGQLVEPQAQARAQLVSRTLRRLAVVLLLADDDQVVAQSWSSGARGPDPRAGLLLTSWPDDVLALLLGRREPADVPGTASSVGRTRWSGARALLRTRPR